MVKHGLFLDPSDPLMEGHIHIKLNSNQERLVISIENYGSGIDPSEYEKIFLKGTRGITGKKRSPIGSGLGLFLAIKVALAFKGKIEVTHDKTKSKTIFKVTLRYD